MDISIKPTKEAEAEPDIVSAAGTITGADVISSDALAVQTPSSADVAPATIPVSSSDTRQVCPRDSSSKPDATPYPWILHPSIDLLFCCGGILWLVFPLHYLVLGEASRSIAAQWLVVLAALGTVLLSQSHAIATLVRIYNDAESRERFSLYTYWFALACSGLALAGCLHKELAGVYCKIYLLIVSQHFTAQTYGIALLYCVKRSYKMSSLDRHILSTLMRATLWYAVLRQCTYRKWSGETFLGQQIPFWGPLPEWMVHLASVGIVVSALALTARILHKYFKEKQFIPFPSLMLIITGVLIFVLDSRMTGILWIYVPAFFHGSQYLVATTAYYLKERGLPEGTSPAQISAVLLTEPALRYIGFLILAGLALFMGVPQLLAQFGFDHGVAVAVIFTTVQFHHVLTDHAIWRLRDNRTRTLLVT